jgi:DNA invertase Pin-like site-specific DNA recombinase
MSTTPWRAAVWGAVSSKKQNAPGTISLDMQISLAQAYAEENKWPVVAVLKMAHSRNYTDLELWKNDLLKSGNDAGELLFRLWKTRAFDVLIVHTLDRLGSKMSMITRVIEETVLMGAVIYVIQDKMTIDRSNYPLISAFGSYFTTARMRKVFEVRAGHWQIRAPLGNPVGRTNLALAHTVQRGKTRADDRVIVDQAQQNVWLDAARLFVDQRVNTRSIEDELYKQFGHVNTATGKPYASGTYYQLLHTVTFWGHTTIGVDKDENRQSDGTYSRSRATWTYDINADPPEGLRLFRNTHPSVYTGELADKVIAELRRRHEVRGRARPSNSHALSGLCICEHCHARLTPQIIPKQKTVKKIASGIKVEGHSLDDYYLYWSCPASYKRNELYYRNAPPCDRTGVISDQKLTAGVIAVLKSFEKLVDSSKLLTAKGKPITVDPVVIEGEIEAIKAQMRRVIDLQISVNADDRIQQQYAERLKELSDRLAIKNAALNTVLNGSAYRESTNAQELLNRLRAFDVEGIWQLSPTTVNQRLHEVLRTCRFLVNIPEKTVVGVTFK